MLEWKWMEAWKWIQEWNEYRNETECSLDGNEGTNQCIVQIYQKEINDKYLESSDIQHKGPGRLISIFKLST